MTHLLTFCQKCSVICMYFSQDPNAFVCSIFLNSRLYLVNKVFSSLITRGMIIYKDQMIKIDTFGFLKLNFNRESSMAVLTLRHHGFINKRHVT